MKHSIKEAFVNWMPQKVKSKQVFSWEHLISLFICLLILTSTTGIKTKAIFHDPFCLSETSESCKHLCQGNGAVGDQLLRAWKNHFSHLDFMARATHLTLLLLSCFSFSDFGWQGIKLTLISLKNLIKL